VGSKLKQQGKWKAWKPSEIHAQDARPIRLEELNSPEAGEVNAFLQDIASVKSPSQRHRCRSGNTAIDIWLAWHSTSETDKSKPEIDGASKILGKVHNYASLSKQLAYLCKFRDLCFIS